MPHETTGGTHDMGIQLKRFIGKLSVAVIALAAVPFVALTAGTNGSPAPMTITVDGLEVNDEAVLRIGVDNGSLNLAGQPLCEYTVKAANGAAQEVEINPTLEDGPYLLAVDAPDKYFREPRGYLFRVYQGAVLNAVGHSIQFKLIPPEARDYEPYRGPMMSPNATAAAPPPPTGGVTYRVEAVVGLSIPPKQPIEVNLPPTIERIPASYWVGLWGAGVGVLVVVGGVIFVAWRAIISRRAKRQGG
jgi:hypothetical protein